jgi:hypothetical protein
MLRDGERPFLYRPRLIPNCVSFLWKPDSSLASFNGHRGPLQCFLSFRDSACLGTRKTAAGVNSQNRLEGIKESIANRPTCYPAIPETEPQRMRRIWVKSIKIRKNGNRDAVEHSLTPRTNRVNRLVQWVPKKVSKGNCLCGSLSSEVRMRLLHNSFKLRLVNQRADF